MKRGPESRRYPPQRTRGATRPREAVPRAREGAREPLHRSTGRGSRLLTCFGRDGSGSSMAWPLVLARPPALVSASPFMTTQPARGGWGSQEAPEEMPSPPDRRAGVGMVRARTAARPPAACRYNRKHKTVAPPGLCAHWLPGATPLAPRPSPSSRASRRARRRW